MADYAMSIKLRGTFDETEADFLDKDLANNLGFMRLYCDDGKIYKEYWDFVFEGSKDMQSTIQIQRQFLDQVSASREFCGLPPLDLVQVWADNANDFKGGDMWSQWQKEIREAGDENGISRVEVCYHAPGEGKTGLDAHFGHLKTERERRERMKMERRNVADLIDSMAAVPATHVVHVKLDREAESRFYHTAKDTKRFHRVVVTANQLEAQEDSLSPLENLKLDKVRERKTTRSRKLRQEQHANVTLTAHLDECQKCLHQMKKNESRNIWIQCEECDRCWHKTCVGYSADTPMNEIEWQKCSQCGGSDPKGQQLVPRRKPAECDFCGRRIRGIDHAACKKDRAAESDGFRTPKAAVVSRNENQKTSRKLFSPAKEKRAQRTGRKRRKAGGKSISPEEFERRKKYL